MDFPIFFSADTSAVRQIRGVISQQSNEYVFFRKQFFCVRALLETYGKQHVLDE